MLLTRGHRVGFFCLGERVARVGMRLAGRSVPMDVTIWGCGAACVEPLTRVSGEESMTVVGKRQPLNLLILHSPREGKGGKEATIAN